MRDDADVVLSRNLCVFFFSSRRRHTRCLSDWSSDVCSSDLDVILPKSTVSRKFKLLGSAKFGVLVRLKASKRSSNRLRSVMGNALKSEKSRRWNPGPETCVLLPPNGA